MELHSASWRTHAVVKIIKRKHLNGIKPTTLLEGKDVTTKL
jgi:hypothetical protein